MSPEPEKINESSLEFSKRVMQKIAQDATAPAREKMERMLSEALGKAYSADSGVRGLVDRSVVGPSYDSAPSVVHDRVTEGEGEPADRDGQVGITWGQLERLDPKDMTGVVAAISGVIDQLRESNELKQSEVEKAEERERAAEDRAAAAAADATTSHKRNAAIAIVGIVATLLASPLVELAKFLIGRM